MKNEHEDHGEQPSPIFSTRHRCVGSGFAGSGWVASCRMVSSVIRSPRLPVPAWPPQPRAVVAAESIARASWARLRLRW